MLMLLSLAAIVGTTLAFGLAWIIRAPQPRELEIETRAIEPDEEHELPLV